VEVALTRVGVSVSELMHRAGYAAAAEMLELGGIDNVVVLTGMGNNGGDGWVAAEALLRKHINVKVVTPIDPDQLSGDLARQVAQSAVRAGVPTLVGPSRDELEGLFSTADAVLDCMLGTGFHGEPVRPSTSGSSASTPRVRAWSPWTSRVVFRRSRAMRPVPPSWPT